MTRVLRIRVKPGSRRGPIIETTDDGTLNVSVRERAIDGAANAAVERVLAEHFCLPPSRVAITRGHTARVKTVVIDD